MDGWDMMSLLLFFKYTLPETNNEFTPENRPSIFRCKLAVSLREGKSVLNQGSWMDEGKFLGSIVF